MTPQFAILRDQPRMRRELRAQAPVSDAASIHRPEDRLESLTCHPAPHLMGSGDGARAVVVVRTYRVDLHVTLWRAEPCTPRKERARAAGGSSAAWEH